jgi:septum site-determining protein MinC
MDDTITLKGIKEGLLVMVKPDAKWTDATNRLITLIDSQGSFFRGAQLTLALGPREVRQNDLASIQRQLEKREVLLRAVLSESVATVGAANKLGLKTELAQAHLDAPPIVEPEPLKPPPIDSEEHGSPGVLIDHTLRNGRTVHSSGHVVVVGDVNAGAQIIATGDVVVWGRLRGVVHAGANGDESAVVCALHLAPTQLRIAGYITISPDDRRRKSKPERALVRNGRIEAESWE